MPGGRGVDYAGTFNEDSDATCGKERISGTHRRACVVGRFGVGDEVEAVGVLAYC